ncbi:hypothetical protein DXG03_001915, partial [Asterophora parasitica]
EWYEAEHSQRHRRGGKQDIDEILELLTGPRAQEAGLVYLQDSSHVFKVKPDGREWSIYGSPVSCDLFVATNTHMPIQWSPYFFNWAFNYHREDGEGTRISVCQLATDVFQTRIALIAKFPKTDILLTHGPPARIFDRTRIGDLVGCEALRARLPELRPRLNVFGHIHEARGAAIHAWNSTGTLGKVQARETDIDELFEVQNNPTADIEDWGSDGELVAATAPSTATAHVPAIPPPVFAHLASTAPAESDNTLRQETVFVNAANWPAGRSSWRGTYHIPFGGPGFQPVIVDLRD